MKKIAWGNSKLLQMYLNKVKDHPFAYCIDNFVDKTEVEGIPIFRSDVLSKEDINKILIVVFAVSNASLRAITQQLRCQGLSYGKGFIVYSDFLIDQFVESAERSLDIIMSRQLYRYALSFTLNSQVLIHTTILGTWMLLEMLIDVNERRLGGQVAEVGIFQGGNALCMLNCMCSKQVRKYYLFDSFEGFPELSRQDPGKFKKGDYKIETSLQEIYDTFSVFPEAKVIKGFVPETFKQVPKDEQFSLVFYDCDLYRPALDTFAFFWDKIVPGGYLIIHDYEVEAGGFAGVKKATDEYFISKGIKICSFYENTMAVIRKGVQG